MNSRIAAILLAAGLSERMGAVNKLALKIDGVALLRHSVQVLLASRIQELVVVLGHQADKIRSLVCDLPIRIVVNPDYRKGQMTSVYAGLEVLSGGFDGIMIGLADQPRLEPGDIDALITAFSERVSGSIVVPTFQGSRGNPIILDYLHREEILLHNQNLGCRRLIEKNPDHVVSFEMPNDHVIVDLDTPKDLAALTAKRGGHSEPEETSKRSGAGG